MKKSSQKSSQKKAVASGCYAELFMLKPATRKYDLICRCDGETDAEAMKRCKFYSPVKRSENCCYHRKYRCYCKMAKITAMHELIDIAKAEIRELAQ